MNVLDYNLTSTNMLNLKNQINSLIENLINNKNL